MLKAEFHLGEIVHVVWEDKSSPAKVIETSGRFHSVCNLCDIGSLSHVCLAGCPMSVANVCMDMLNWCLLYYRNA